MNYTLWNLPINLDNGKVKLSLIGMSVVVETDFGLVVQYDWKQYLDISISGDFAGKVCGLCGNFNSKQDDDLFTPSGELAGSEQALGKSWRVPGMAEDAYCRDECVGQCKSCKSDSLFESLMGRLFCSFLSNVMDGPLSECSAVIGSKVFHEICMYDVCMGEGKWHFFCNTLQVYSDACQRAGVKVHDWRHIAHCPNPTCPENSHYEFCGIACPATCETPDAPSKCKANCVETCVCDNGFLLSGTKCIPKTECGCMYEGHYVEAGASFWVDDHCMQRGFCNPANRQMEYKKKGCEAGYECKVVDGLVGCHLMTYATCRVSGDPHYKTFDGHVYNFQGTCVYQMAGTCSKSATPGSPVLEPFDVLVQNDGHAKRVGSSTKLVEVKVYGNSIVLSKDHRGSLLINSELTNLPANLNQGNVTVKLIGNFAEIETDFGLTVYYDWNTAVYVKVPSGYAGAMCGLCGNYNLNSKDDLVMKNGRQAASAEEMGKSWRVAETPGCADDCKDKNHCPDCDFTQIEKFESNKFCGLIRDPKGPFQNCHAIVPPGGFFKDCVDDVCNNNGNLHSFCDSLHLYTITCQQAGVEVDQWRTNDFCPKLDFKHPNNSHYEHCAGVCHIICDVGSPPVGCKKPCQEGWVCNDEFLLSGDVCVPIEQCGCMHKDKYYKHGQIFYPHGQCQEECTCNGTVQCQKFSCGAHEKCEVKNGIRSCQPVGKGVCSISGDPHYNTFDNSTYDFQGTCTYTAAKACNLNGTRLPAFSVAVENERWYAMTSNPKVSVAKLVSVTVYGNTLILRKNQIGMIMLNGIMTTIPLNINEKQVQVYQEGTYYLILTDFGLRVTYDMIYHITVTVPGNYRGRTCGLCGNFNDNKADEFQLPGGKVTKDLLSFGAAWKVAVPGVVCEDGCSGDICPKCDASKKEVFEKDCQILTDPQGPFAACHNVIDPNSYYRDCVYDVCLAVGDRKVLCDSISAYMMDCQAIGVTILTWRTPAFCPLSCSANSHHQICAITCDTPCPGLSDIISCPTTCAEGCACDDGYYFNGTGCISWDKCGCFINGRTYKIGESVLLDNCQQLCTCTVSGRAQCVDTKCGNAESCEIQNGLLGCFPKRCELGTGGSFTLFNGITGAIKPTMAAYELVENCDPSAPGEWFRVVAKLQECSLTASKSVSALYVFFSDIMVAVTDKHETWVNGQKVILPVQLRKDISVGVSGKSIHLEKKAGFRLSYSWSQGVTVTISNDIAGKVCGVCGPLSSSKNSLEISQETMQEYIAPFIAQDFPTWLEATAGPTNLLCYVTADDHGLSSALPTGREFATAFMQNLYGDSDARFMIEVSAPPSTKGSTKVKVSAMGQVFEKDVDPGKGVSFTLPDSVEMQGSTRFNKTVVIEASQDVTVLSFNFKQDTADTSVVYPLQEWGTEYYIFTPPSYVSGTYKEFSITNHKEHNFAEVRLRGSGFFLYAGLTVELYSQWPNSIYLTSDKGIQVLFEFNGGPVDVQQSFDPFLMSILPTNQYSKSYSLEGQQDFSNSVILVAKDNDLKDVQLDMNPLPASMEWHKVDGSDYFWAELNYSTGASSNQISHPTSPIGVYSFGVAVANGGYAGAMCGLCGNYNLNSKDDLVMKNGRQAASAEEMGKSWRVAETPGCADDCKDKNHCPDCDFTQIEKFESNKFCGLIRDPKGPFQNCHAIVPPGGFFKDCVDDVCNNNGNLHSFCDSLHLYTITCQQAGVEVDQWRTNDFCPKLDFKHPNNSHYEHCAGVCHIICDVGSPPVGCKKPCQEGWVCNDEFLLSGDVCVPIEQCGCMHKDKYYKHGQIFYPHGQCQEECTCNGTVQCQKFSCGAHEKCEVKNGIRSCQPVGKGVCSISGDPHYNTFDNSTYDFQGTCTYTAAKACNLNGTRLPAFSVAVENERWYAMTSNPKVSVAKLVSVTVYGNTLILRKNQIGMIMLNGIMTTIPLNINEKQVQVYQEGTYYLILTDFGLRVTYDMIYHITVTVPGNYRGRTCGLCGNFNDNKADEFQLPGGKVTKDLLSFGAAWKVAVPGVVCEDGCSGDICPKCDASKKEVFEKDCQILTDPQGPFAACHNVIDPNSYYRDCVYDVCLAVGDRKVLCDSISAYMMDCQAIGVTILTWRTPAFCPLSCSANSHHQICAITCDTPCPGLSDIISCPTTCAEGCACDDGYYFNGTGCISWDKCGCFINGRTYKIGESVLLDNCQQLCTCTVSGRAQCVDTKCGNAESCEIQNGLLGCFPKRCELGTGGSFTLFNGITGAIKPTMAAYELVENCDPSAPGEWFRVVAKLQECSLTASKSVSALYVFFSDIMVAVTDKHETWVNGQKVILPVQLRKDISVGVSGKSIHLEKKAGFRLSYSWSQGVTVTISNDIAGKVCGVCGPLSSSKNSLEISQETMQEYIAPFIAQDFPTW
ncbi:unnamed protein product [Merluccius merluccius]